MEQFPFDDSALVRLVRDSLACDWNLVDTFYLTASSFFQRLLMSKPG